MTILLLVKPHELWNRTWGSWVQKQEHLPVCYAAPSVECFGASLNIKLNLLGDEINFQNLQKMISLKVVLFVSSLLLAVSQSIKPGKLRSLVDNR